MARRVVIEYTDTFRQSYRDLPEPIRKKVQKQIRFLSQDPSHRSLHIHKLRNNFMGRRDPNALARKYDNSSRVFSN